MVRASWCLYSESFTSRWWRDERKHPIVMGRRASRRIRNHNSYNEDAGVRLCRSAMRLRFDK